MEDMVTDNETSHEVRNSDPPPPGTINRNDMLVELSKFEVFSPGKCMWPSYVERLQNYFELYNVPDPKRVRILIDRIDSAVYEKLRQFCEPESPLNKTFEELSEILDKYFNPFSNKFKERVKFIRRVQRAREGVLKYATELTKWAKNCRFPESWFQEALVTQFMCGVRSDFLRGKLFQLEENDFDKIVEFAIDIEANEPDAMATAAGAATAKLANGEKKTSTNEAQPSNAEERDDGTLEQIICYTCFQPGHKSPACKERKKQKPSATKPSAIKNLPNKAAIKNKPANPNKNMSKNQNKGQFKYQNKTQFKPQSKPQYKPFSNFYNWGGQNEELKDVLRNQYKDFHNNDYSNRNYTNYSNTSSSSTFMPNRSMF